MLPNVKIELELCAEYRPMWKLNLSFVQNIARCLQTVNSVMWVDSLSLLEALHVGIVYGFDTREFEWR